MTSLFGLLLLFATPQQPVSELSSFREQGEALLSQSRPAEAEIVFTRWVERDVTSSDAHYALALSRALQGRVMEAREEFERALAIAPGRADAYFEIAAGFLGQKEYSQALAWVAGGLRRSPSDPFGLDLAGTVHFLNGGKVWALRYWNRLGKPHLRSLRIEGQGRVDRQVIADAISLAPGDLLSWTEIQRARWRLAQYRYLRDVVFEPVPGATPDDYDLLVTVDARKGIGSPAELLFATVAGLGSRALQLTYWNIGGTGTTFSSRLRWAADSRLMQSGLEVAGFMHTPVSASISYTHRDETRTFAAPSDGFRVQRTDVDALMTFPLKLSGVSMAFGGGTRQRRFAQLAPATLMDGEGRPAQDLRDGVAGVFWIRALPTVSFSERRSPSGWVFRPVLRGGIETGWAADSGSLSFSRLFVSSSFKIQKVVPGSRQPDLALSLNAGGLSSQGLAEDHFVLAQGPDANVQLRAHPFLRAGQPGAVLLASRFVLGNVTAGTDVKTWKLLTVGAVGFADIGQLVAPYPDRGTARRLFDAGLGLELGTPLSHSRVTLVWGRDWVSGQSVVYVAASLR